MRRMVALAAVALLAGCAAAPTNTPQAFCARNAEQDPAVRGLIIARLGSPYPIAPDDPQLVAARDAAVETCLRRQGVPPPAGGVERAAP